VRRWQLLLPLGGGALLQLATGQVTGVTDHRFGRVEGSFTASLPRPPGSPPLLAGCAVSTPPGHGD
jgi:hypothetical protein